MTMASFFKKGIKEAERIADFWSAAKAGTFGASVAYYAIFSFAPILVITISIASFFVARDAAAAGLIREFTSVFGQSGAALVDSLLKADVSAETSIITSIIGFAVLILGAAGVFGALEKALDTIFESLPAKGKKSFWQAVRHKLLSYGMVLSLGFILLVSLAVSAAISFLAGKVTGMMPGTEIFARIADFLVSFLFVSFFLTILYKFLPSRRLAWKPAIAGGAMAGVLFTISKYALGMYLGSSSKFDSYGAASALVLFVVWAYYMAQVFFFAAVLTRLYVVPKMAK